MNLKIHDHTHCCWPRTLDNDIVVQVYHSLMVDVKQRQVEAHKIQLQGKKSKV